MRAGHGDIVRLLTLLAPMFDPHKFKTVMAAFVNVALR